MLRYFGSALAGTRRAHIKLDWPGEYTLRIAIADAGFTWRMTMAASAATGSSTPSARFSPTECGARPLSWR
jgi:hypothetical protein